MALNTAILGIVEAGDRVITSGMEHNSVMRPLVSFGDSIDLQIAQCSADGLLDLNDLENKIQKKTKLVVINHASNVCSTIQDIKKISKLTRTNGAILLVDSAQTAGSIGINMKEMGIDLLAFTGHKSLHGPPGTGGLAIGDEFDLSLMKPLMFGGTGSLSSETRQPLSLPDKYESGTQNSVGIVGLGQALREIEDSGLDMIRKHETELTAKLKDGLEAIEGVNFYGLSDVTRSTSIVSITISGKHNSEVGERLDDEFGILCRVGLHCAPIAHKTLGTFPNGTIRLAPGKNTTIDDIEYVLDSIIKVAKS